jgi:hypothetical protein
LGINPTDWALDKKKYKKKGFDRKKPLTKNLNTLYIRMKKPKTRWKEEERKTGPVDDNIAGDVRISQLNQGAER